MTKVNTYLTKVKNTVLRLKIEEKSENIFKTWYSLDTFWSFGNFLSANVFSHKAEIWHKGITGIGIQTDIYYLGSRRDIGRVRWI